MALDRLSALAAKGLAAFLMLGITATAWAQPASAQKKVLVIYSTQRDTQFSTLGDRLLPTLLQTSPDIRTDYYSEYIEAPRFPDPQYREAFRHYLALKYGGTHVDLVVAALDLAVTYVSSIRDALFPGVPIVFLAQSPPTVRLPNSAGVVVSPLYGGTLEFALQLQPDTSHVYVVVGNSLRDQAAEAAARPQLTGVSPALDVTFLSGLTTEALERRVSALPAHAIVYYLLFYQDAAGVNVSPVDYLERLSAISNRPVYSWVDSTIGRGVVGGDVVSIDAQLQALARVAVRVLRGERADAIGTVRSDLHAPQVDWRQLQRWNISASRLPPGTVVRYREPGLFERYRSYVMVTAIVLIAQTALIAGLFVQAGRRRRAEARARASEAQLRTTYDRVRDLSARLLAAQESERTRIARELHDDIGQQLTLLAIDLDLLSGLEAPRNAEAERLANELTERARAAARGVHDISHRLHPPRLRLMGLVPALEALAGTTTKPGVSVTVTHERVPAGIPTDVMLSLYRIAQEAVQNALKYANARVITIHLAGVPRGLSLTIADDGEGFDVAGADSKGLGLSSMRERLEPFGGVLHIQSQPGAGTRVEAVVPPDALAATTSHVGERDAAI